MSITKALIFLSALILLSSALKLKMHNKMQQASSSILHTVLLLGDVGQFEAFQQAKSNIFDLEGSARSIDYTCNKFNEANKDKMMINFQRILKTISTLKNLNEAVLLGDMVYTEIKALGFKTEENGSKNPFGIDYLEKKDEYMYRLHCGWKYLKTLLKDNNLLDMITLINGNHSYDVSYTMEATYLADFPNKNNFFLNMDEEVEQKKDGISRWDALKPRVTLANSDKVSIAYINLDPSMLVCSDKLIYQDKTINKVIQNAKELKAMPNVFMAFKNCINERWANKYPELEYLTNLTINQYIRYHRQVLMILKNLTKIGGYDWRIVRMHQPIFNPEFDYFGIKLNPVLMRAFRDAHVHMFWVSHNHSGQVDLSIYEDSDYKYKFASPVYVGSSVRKDEPNASINNSTMIRESCVGTEDPYYDAKWTMAADKKLSPNCIDRSSILVNSYAPQNSTVKFGRIYLNDDNEEMIMQILVGNSGRVLDPLFSDKFSDMYILYGNTGFNTHGYSIAEFGKEGDSKVCRVKFFGLESGKDDAKVVLKYTLEVVLLEGKNKIAKRKDLLAKNFKIDLVKELENKYSV